MVEAPGPARDFEATLRARNGSALRLGAALAATLVPAFYFLDFFVIPAHVRLTFFVRLAVAGYAAGLLVAGQKRPAWVAAHADGLAVSLCLLVSGMIAIPCWLGEGYESPYVAGLNLVFLTAGLIFSWRPRLVLVFHVLVYGVYMAPLLLGRLQVHDLTLTLSNQFFLAQHDAGHVRLPEAPVRPRAP